MNKSSAKMYLECFQDKGLKYEKSPHKVILMLTVIELYEKNVSRTISRTVWRSVIKEDDVEEIVKTIPDIECVDGKYILWKK